MASDDTLRVLLPGGGGGQDVLGLWQPAASEGPAPVWELDAPEAAPQVSAMLAAATRQATMAAQGIPTSEARLQRFMVQYRQGTVSFSAPAALPEPERRLAVALAAPAESFGLRDEVAEAAQQARDFAEQVQRLMGQAALVRTTVAGRLLAQTRVGWSGDAQSSLRAGVSRAEASMHERAVRLALATSQAWLRIATLLGAAAVQLSLLLPTGLGALRAIPAAWGFITAILEEYRQLRRSFN